ncbi:MAG: DUF3820 family protein [Eubacterium sp.]|jgi:hypothetical protein|nr:DUF3820 family protein [Eubacterium sp.]
MLTDIETKLLRLALDKGAYEGEANTAAIMFIRKLRERGANTDDLFIQPHTQIKRQYRDISVYGYQRMPFGKYKGEMLYNIPRDYLIWVLKHCKNIKSNLKNAIYDFVYEI